MSHTSILVDDSIIYNLQFHFKKDGPLKPFFARQKGTLVLINIKYAILNRLKDFGH